MSRALPGVQPPAVELDTAPPVARGRRARGRLWSLLAASWGAVTGLAPHVLHHVGPLAGAAFLGGLAGTAVFGAVGFVATIPLLLRLRRRFGTWWAPGIALAVFVTVFTVSTTVVGPRVAGPADAADAVSEEDHDAHHA